MYALSLMESLARKHLIKKYDNPPSFHDIKIINDIIFNEETHFVAIFKEYLIYEEMNEFLKRFYYKEEIRHKMPKILLFYEKYSKIYANYTQLPESKYMYKNIKRKQKMIDKLQEIEEEEMNSLGRNRSDEYSDVFTTKALDSINSVTMSLYKQDSFSNTQSSLCESINQMIDKLSIIEKKKKGKLTNMHNTNINHLMKHDVNQRPKKNNFNINYITNIKKKSSASNSTNTTTTNKKNSTLISPTIKAKAIERKIVNKNSTNSSITTRTNKYKNPNSNLYYKIQYNELKQKIFSSEKQDKILVSGNSSRAKTERVVSSPKGPSQNVKNICSPRGICNSVNNSNNNIRKIEVKKSQSKPTSKTKTSSSHMNKLSNQGTNIVNAYHSKIFSSRLSQKNINASTHSSLSNSKSKSTPKHSNNTKTKKGKKGKNENIAIVNNVNIINNIQTNSTQINIYNCNDLFKSIHFHNGILHPSVVKKAKQNAMLTSTTHLNSSNTNSKPKQKFELNIRKLMHKNIIESESSTDRYSTNNNNIFEKIGKNYFNKKHHVKVNSAAISKISTTESKAKKSLSGNSSGNNNNINLNSHNVNKVAEISKIKLKNLYDLSQFMLKNNNCNSAMIHSERNKKSKISFK